MPTLGGSTTLRGFSEFRFRDRNAFLINAEYRWEAFSGLDMALFGDWGDVATDVGRHRLQPAQVRLRHRLPLQHVPAACSCASTSRSSRQEGVPGQHVVQWSVLRIIVRPSAPASRVASSRCAAGRGPCRRLDGVAPRFYGDDPISEDPERRMRRGGAGRSQRDLRLRREQLSQRRRQDRTSAPSTSTRSTTCPTRAGSRSAWAPPKCCRSQDVIRGPYHGAAAAARASGRSSAARAKASRRA